MKKVILYEFDKAQEFVLSEKDRHEFEQYLQEIWETRYFFDQANYSDTQQYNSSQKILDIYPGSVKARNYAGFIRFEETEIQIFPKIFAKSGNNDTHLIFRHLNYYLSYCNLLSLPFTVQMIDYQSSASVLDMWENLFVEITRQYLAQQPHFAYEHQVKKTAYLQGKLDMTAYIDRSISRGNWHQPVSSFNQWTLDNQFNQLVKYVFQLLHETQTRPDLDDQISEVLFLLRTCSFQHFKYQDCKDIYHQLSHPIQKTIVQFCEIFLLNGELNVQRGTENNFFFLLPMERVFEQFIAGFIQEHFPEEEAKYQSSSFLAKDKKDGSSAFLIKQDIYLPRKHQIIDTKYKIRSNHSSNQQTGIDTKDMYQMLSYGLSKNCKDMVLLYPKSFQDADYEVSNKEFVVDGELLGEHQIQIKACNLDISIAQESNFKEVLDQKIKLQLQKHLFGEKKDNV